MNVHLLRKEDLDDWGLDITRTVAPCGHSTHVVIQTGLVIVTCSNRCDGSLAFRIDHEETDNLVKLMDGNPEEAAVSVSCPRHPGYVAVDLIGYDLSVVCVQCEDTLAGLFTVLDVPYGN